VIYSLPLDLDPTVKINRGGGAHRLGFRRGSPACWVLETLAGDVLVVYRGEGEVDGVLRDDINSMVTTAQSFVSLVDVEVWPETWARRVMARSSIC
jgi:hypothetical protein